MKWRKKPFFHLLDLAIIKSYILLSSMWWEEITQRFSTHPYQRDAGTGGHDPRTSMSVGRPAPASSNIGRLDTRHNKHRPGCNSSKRRCRVFSKGRDANGDVQCVKCDAALCVDRNCVADYHTKNSL